MTWVYDDGGALAAGYRKESGDCFARAVSIAAGVPYRDAVDIINAEACQEHAIRGRRGLLAATGRGSSARNGVFVDTAKRVMSGLGWTWTATMGVGQGCRVHLRSDELPSGRIICRVSKHYVAVVDSVMRDTHDPSRNGTRCVYGYWCQS